MKIVYTRKVFTTLIGGEVGYYDHGAVEAQGSSDLRVDPVDTIQNVVFNIIKEKTTSDLWKVLSNMYEKSSIMNKVNLMRRLFNLQMSEGGFVVDHINEYNMIVSQPISVEINFEDEIKALIEVIFTRVVGYYCCRDQQFTRV